MPNVEVNGFSMYYELVGEGPPVLCTTGWGTGTGHKVAAYPEQLPARHQMIVYDHRGIGRSEGGLDAEPSTELYADDLAALMDHLDIDRASVFGRGGLGGCIAQQFAIRHPQRTVSAIFGQSWVRTDPFLHAQFEALYRLRQQDFYAFQQAAAWICHAPRYFNENSEELLGPTGAWSELIEFKDGQLALMRASMSHDTSATIGSVTCPALILQGGDRDWITGTRLGEELHALLPAAEFVVLADAPHGVKTEPAAWRQYTDAVMTFLASAPMNERGDFTESPGTRDR